MRSETINLTTGIRCNTGGLHLGHFIGNITPLINYEGPSNLFFIISDSHPTNSSKSMLVNELIIDSLACGLDSKEVVFVRQSELRRFSNPISEILFEYSTQCQLEKVHPRKNFIRNGGSLLLSDYLFPFQQAVDVLALHSNFVISNDDNLALVNYSRYIAKKFNRSYHQNIFSYPHLMHGEIKKVLGWDRRKMCRANDNCLNITCSQLELEEYVEKIFMFTDRVRGITDGKIKRNLAFLYLDGLRLTDSETQKIKENYKNNSETETQLKEYLFSKLNSLFIPFRQKKEFYKNHPEIIQELLFVGSEYIKSELPQFILNIMRTIESEK